MSDAKRGMITENAMVEKLMEISSTLGMTEKQREEFYRRNVEFRTPWHGPGATMPIVAAPDEVAALRHERDALWAECRLLRGENAWLRRATAQTSAKPYAPEYCELTGRLEEIRRLRAWLSVIALTHPSAVEALRGDAAPDTGRWG